MGPSWIARSVLTGHVAEAKTADAAIEHLRRAIDAAIVTAVRLGLSLEEWYRQQESDPGQVLRYARVAGLVNREVETLKFAVSFGFHG